MASHPSHSCCLTTPECRGRTVKEPHSSGQTERREKPTPSWPYLSQAVSARNASPWQYFVLAQDTDLSCSWAERETGKRDLASTANTVTVWLWRARELWASTSGKGQKERGGINAKMYGGTVVWKCCMEVLKVWKAIFQDGSTGPNPPNETNHFCSYKTLVRRCNRLRRHVVATLGFQQKPNPNINPLSPAFPFITL